MIPYNNFSPMYSSYSQYDQNSYQSPTYQNSYPYHHQINAYQFPSSCDPYNYSSYNSYSDHTLQNSYIHDNQPYPSQEQSTQSSELHDILMKLQNDSVNKTKELQNSTDTLERISALFDRINKTLDTYEKGETCDEDNLIINLSDEEEKSKMNDQDLSHQTPLDPIVEHEYISQFDDGVICKKDGKDMEESNEVYKSDSDSIHDLCYYFEDDFKPHCLADEYDNDNDDDIISINEIKRFDEEIKDVIPHPTIHEPLNIEIEDESDSHDLNAKNYNLDQSIEKDAEESSTMIPTTRCTSENVIYDESQLLEKLNYEYDDPYMISISNEYNDPPIFPSAHEIIDCETKESESMMSDSHVLEDMKTISNLGSTERNIEETPISLPIIPHTPYYQVHDENIILEDMSYEYHDPFLIKRDTDHSCHIPPLSCMHHLFTKIPKIFSFSFSIFKIKNYKNMSLQEKFLPENLNCIHWEDDFPIFILVYDLD